MEADYEEPEVPFSQRLVVHSPGNFREPVIEGGENAEENATHDYIVKVRHHVIRIAELPIQRRYGERHSGQSGDEKLEQKSHTEQHRRGEANFAAPHSGEPIE